MQEKLFSKASAVRLEIRSGSEFTEGNALEILKKRIESAFLQTNKTHKNSLRESPRSWRVFLGS